MKFVPVSDIRGVVLMPCHAARARQLIKKGRAKPKYRLGIYCIQLQYEVEPNNQEVVVRIDPGSKKEAYTVMGAGHTFINIQSDTIGTDFKHDPKKSKKKKKPTNWISKKLINRRENIRHSRRSRNSPCRANKMNRRIGGIAPSTRSRWQLKMRILNIISGLYPITKVIVEDIKAWTFKKAKKWNQSFSPLEVGKNWFYEWVSSKWELKLIQGFETAQLRKQLGLKKSSNKMSDKWDAHCVDSWTIANSVIGLSKPDNERMLLLYPINMFRRQLHIQCPAKGGVRKRYGGTKGMIENGKVLFRKGAVILHDGFLRIAGGYDAAKRSVEIKTMKGQRVHRLISLKNVQIVVPWNSFGWEYR